MSLTTSEWITLLRAEVPETADSITKHLVYYDGELLLHLLVGDDLRLLALDWFRNGPNNPLQRLLSVLERGLIDGDEYVENAVAVSFIEDLGLWDPKMHPFIDALPARLLAEVERQRSHGQ